MAVAMDLKGGLIDRFRSMPISRSVVLFAHTFADLLVGLIGLAIVTGFGLLLGLALAHRPAALAGFALVAVFLYVMLWLGVLFA